MSFTTGHPEPACHHKALSYCGDEKDEYIGSFDVYIYTKESKYSEILLNKNNKCLFSCLYIYIPFACKLYQLSTLDRCKSNNIYIGRSIIVEHFSYFHRTVWKNFNYFIHYRLYVSSTNWALWIVGNIYINKEQFNK